MKKVSLKMVLGTGQPHVQNNKLDHYIIPNTKNNKVNGRFQFKAYNHETSRRNQNGTHFLTKVFEL